MGRQAYWQEKLGSFTFDIVHRSGTKHGNADGVSWIPCSEDRASCPQSFDLCAHILDQAPDEPEGSKMHIQGWDWENIQKTDPDLGEIYAAFQANPTERPTNKLYWGGVKMGKF